MNIFNYIFRSTAEKINFTLFGKVHLLIIAIAVGVSYMIIKKMEVNKRFEFLIGSILLMQQIILYSWYFASNYNILTEGLPLYHCRVAILALALGLLFKINIFLRVGTYWGIFGSIGALLLPGLDPFAFPHITNFSYFVGHLFLLWGSIYMIFVKKIGFTKVDLKNILIFTNIYHLIVFKLNNKIGSNYAYLSEPPFKISYPLNSYFYAFLVIMIFNTVLLLEYLFLKKENLDNYDIMLRTT